MLLGTTSGVYDDRLEPLGLAGERISALHAGADFVLAGSYGNGLFRHDGSAWSRVEAPAPCRQGIPRRGGGPRAAFLCIYAREGALLAGTEPGLILRSEDGGRSWHELEGFTALPGRDEWFLPYSPRAGAVRNLHFTQDGRVFASVEVGGLARSDDGGASWVCEPVLADDDIHHITGDGTALYASLGSASLPSSAPDAPLAGIARSDDGGRRWRKIETDYTRATLIPSTRPDLLLAGPALRVGHLGRIAVSSDHGESWEPAAGGIETPMPDMVERFAEAPDGSVLAICAGGRLLRAEPGQWQWTEVAPGLQVKSIAFP